MQTARLWKRFQRGSPRRYAGATAMAFAALVVVASSLPAAAYPRPGRTERVPSGNNGGQSASVSASGRYVAFTSGVALVPEDTNGAGDVFVADRETGSVERVSVTSEGAQVDDCPSPFFCSGEASISADGRYVAFYSAGSSLVPGDTNEVADTFVHDRVTGATERVSVASDGTQGNARSQFTNTSISADGRYVAFTSEASNLVPDDTNAPATDVFVHDRATGVTERVSVASDGTQGNIGSSQPSISADGRYVAFFGFASTLVPDDTNAANDIFVRDRETETTERVSVASDGTEANGHSFRDPSISADGRYVAFYGSATNLVPGDTNGAEDVFVHDRETGATERVSVASDGAEGNASSLIPSISADGRYVSFHSSASNLVPGDTNGTADTFVHDRETRATERVSVTSEGGQGTGDSFGWASISADGRYVAFHSPASNLVPGDTNGEFGVDMFVRDRGPAVGVGALSAAPGEGGVEVSGWATVSGRRLTGASDPSDDGADAADAAGAELTEAGLIHRPELEDLLVRLRVASLPGMAVGACPEGVCVGTSTGAGSPAVVYGLGFDLGDVRYEVRAVRAGATGVPPAAPLFALYRCEVACIEHARLSGGIGTSGSEVLVSLPLDSLDAPVEGSLTEVRAFAALGEGGPGALVALDEVELPDASLSAPRVQIGIAPRGAPQSDVAFDTEAALSDGVFSGTMQTFPPASGDHEIWARACLGQACGAAATAARF